MKVVSTALALLVGALIGYGVASFRTGPHIANAQPFAGNPLMCSNGGNVPGGYVVVNTSNSANCTGADGAQSGFMYQLAKPQTTGGVTSAVICTGTPFPAGFVTTGWNNNAHTCAAGIPGTNKNNQQSIASYQ